MISIFVYDKKYPYIMTILKPGILSPFQSLRSRKLSRPLPFKKQYIFQKHIYEFVTLLSINVLSNFHHSGFPCSDEYCQHEHQRKGPEIRTGFLKDGKPVPLSNGQEITISTDYNIWYHHSDRVII